MCTHLGGTLKRQSLFSTCAMSLSLKGETISKLTYAYTSYNNTYLRFRQIHIIQLKIVVTMSKDRNCKDVTFNY